MRKVYAVDLLEDPTVVTTKEQCHVPEGASLNAFGEKIRRVLKQHNRTTRIDKYRLMSASLFKKNASIASVEGDLVVVGACPRNVITSSIVLREGDFVYTNSQSVYELGDEVTEEELVAVYPLLAVDMVEGTPEHARILKLSE
jgi:hypothetical protein